VEAARRPKREVPSWVLNLGVALFLVAFANLAFFRNVMTRYTWTLGRVLFLGSLAILLASLTMLLLTLLDARALRKPLLILVLLLSSITAYYMDRFNVVLDPGMIRNIVQTDRGEASDLITPTLLLYVLLLGLAPSFVVARIRVARPRLLRALRLKLSTIVVVVLVVALQLLAFNRAYASFFREHKRLRYYANPLTCLYSIGKYLTEDVEGSRAVAPRGTDARIPADDVGRELLILVVGETARADHFSLNGYARPTNPLLAKEDVISLRRMIACGTSTAVSLPCMFSGTPQAKFRAKDAEATENLLDVLVHAGVHVLWRENNTGSKGVADRIEHQNFRVAANNPVCDTECRDEGMLSGLQEYIDGKAQGDIVIVLHQMGNHGPAYYKRYPQAFERFTPVCRTGELSECSVEEINNAYDNAILYTDYFLSLAIELLRKNDDRFETCLFYVSDHGESLGEHGVYLHGMPRLLAPAEQLEVAAVVWLGKKAGVDPRIFRTRADQPSTHDNVFHTVLGFLEIQTSVYDAKLDLFAPARLEESKPATR
jgi:lipid A ethanolaminephosphotransferase